MNELDILVKPQLGTIETNFEEVKEALALQMSAYTDLEVTEDIIPERKKDVAVLRKIRKSVDEKRKDVKRDFMQPYDVFDKQVKELIGLIDEPITLIDKKLKEFEEKRIAEKQAHLQELYDANISGMQDFLPFNVVKRDKWDNKTCTDSEIIGDIQTEVIRVRGDLDAIKALRSEIEDRLIDVYKREGLGAALKANTDYLDAKHLAEQKLQEERVKKTEEHVETIDDIPDVTLPEEYMHKGFYTVQTETSRMVTFFVSESDADTVVTLLEVNGIEYRRS